MRVRTTGPDPACLERYATQHRSSYQNSCQPSGEVISGSTDNVQSETIALSTTNR